MFTTTEKGNIMSIAIKEGITLDGKKAKICGRLRDFAQVVQYQHIYDCPRPISAEFSWEAVQRIVANDGAFKS